MAATSYKVTLHNPDGKVLTTFGVTASSDDEAKRLTTEWLVERGYIVRAISFSTKQERSLLAYANSPPAKA